MAQQPEQMLSRRQIRVEAFQRAVFGGEGSEVARADVEAAMLFITATGPAEPPVRKPELQDS
jgi:hypothetical protein